MVGLVVGGVRGPHFPSRSSRSRRSSGLRSRSWWQIVRWFRRIPTPLGPRGSQAGTMGSMVGGGCGIFKNQSLCEIQITVFRSAGF